MLSYQHGFHAGCFADVVKHLVLCHILQYMTIKDAPLLYLDTHAGRGIYNLKQQAQKTSEYKQGIELLWHNMNQLPSEYNTYINLIKTLLLSWFT